MSGLTREREAAVIGLWVFHPVLSSLLYWLWFGLRSSFRVVRVFRGGSCSLSPSQVRAELDFLGFGAVGAQQGELPGHAIKVSDDTGHAGVTIAQRSSHRAHGDHDQPR